MSTILRDAIIRIKLEQIKTKLEAPDVSAASRAYETEKKAIAETVKVKQESALATKELAATTNVSTQLMLGNFREGGEGALRMARGIAFLSASGSEDLRKLVQTVAVAQGAFDIFAGGFKVFTNLGPVLGTVTVAVGIGVIALNRYTASLEAAAVKARELLLAERAAAENRKRIAEEIESIAARGLSERTGAALSPFERSRRLGIELGDINMRSGNARGEIERIDLARRYKQADIEAAKLEKERLPANRVDAFFQYRGHGIGGAIEAGEAMARRRHAEQAEADARQDDINLRTRQQSLLEQDVSDRRRAFEIEKERFETERERLGQSIALQSGFLAAAGAGAIGGPAAVATGLLAKDLNNQSAQKIDLLARETQQALDKLIDVVTSNSRKLAELKRELDQANPE